MESKLINFHSIFDGSEVWVKPDFVQMVSVCEVWRGTEKVFGTSITVPGGHQLWLREPIEQVLCLVKN